MPNESQKRWRKEHPEKVAEYKLRRKRNPHSTRGFCRQCGIALNIPRKSTVNCLGKENTFNMYNKLYPGWYQPPFYCSLRCYRNSLIPFKMPDCSVKDPTLLLKWLNDQMLKQLQYDPDAKLNKPITRWLKLREKPHSNVDGDQ